MNTPPHAPWMSFALIALLHTGCTIPSPTFSPCHTDGRFGACCDDQSPCDEGLSCHESDGQYFCTVSCSMLDTTCPQDGACTLIDSQTICVPQAGRVGDSCDPEQVGGCRPGLSCLGTLGMGFCTTPCDPEDLCPAKSLVGERVCVGLSDGMGAYCARPCQEDMDCALGLACTEVPGTGWRVCFPLSDPQASETITRLDRSPATLSPLSRPRNIGFYTPKTRNVPPRCLVASGGNDASV
jgi:hypothetical protein